MLNPISEERLQDLFALEKWQDHFTALSETLGISISIYSGSGSPIFVPHADHPLCKGFIAASGEFQAHCESFCRPSLLGVLSTGRPAVYQCYAKIMHFALPVEYGDEKAVVRGQGSFATYEDFRECMDQLSSSGIDTLSITAPLVFTDAPYLLRVSAFVNDSITRLLRNTRETAVLRKRVENLKTAISGWSSAGDDLPETLYAALVNKLSSMLDIGTAVVLTHDRPQKRYQGVHSIGTGMQQDSFSLTEQDPIIKRLASGEPHVLSPGPVADPDADLLNGLGAFYFFPILVNKRLESILGVADKELSENDTNLITAFCRQTALLVENQQLHRDLNRKLDHMAVIAELTGTSTSQLDPKILLQTILDKSAALLMAEKGSLMLLDRETEALLLEAKKGFPDSIAGTLVIPKGSGIAGKVAELGIAFLVADLEDDPRIMQKKRQRYRTNSFVSIPLKAEGRIIGVLNLSDKTTGEVFDEDDLALIQSFATHAAVVLERNTLYSQAEKLKKQSITDDLTGLLNRRYLHERLEEELSRAARFGRPLSLLMVDLDGFKQYNDTYGHLLGDKILRLLAETIVQSVRTMDVVSRFGGDEFVIILPETDGSSAAAIAERVRLDTARTALPAAGTASSGPPSNITASIGIACYPAHGSSIEQLLAQVDTALYRAKSRGKNRIEVFS